MAATPLMQQYYEIKKQNPGCILFFRMGDFFELFEDDAVIASKILGLTLTSRNNGASGATPLCGFPHHAADRYVPKMVAAGYRIAICEQVEDPKLAKGIVKRDIVEIISAGTAMDETNLNAKEANYLFAYVPSGKDVAFAVADVTTGYLAACRSSVQSFECEFSRRMPKEIIVPEGCEIPSSIMDLVRSENVLVTELPAFLFTVEQAKDVLFSHFKVEALDGLGLDGRDDETVVTGALLQYLSRLPEYTKEQREAAVTLLQMYSGRGIRFAFFQRFPFDMRRNLGCDDRVFCEAVASTKSTVKLFYRIRYENEPFTEVTMKDVFEGIRVREFVLFEGEQLECYTEETKEDGSKVVSSHRVLKAGAVPEELQMSRYGRMNQMARDLEKGDEAAFREELKEYRQLDALTKELFTLL